MSEPLSPEAKSILDRWGIYGELQLRIGAPGSIYVCFTVGGAPEPISIEVFNELTNGGYVEHRHTTFSYGRDYDVDLPQGS